MHNDPIQVLQDMIIEMERRISQYKESDNPDIYSLVPLLEDRVEVLQRVVSVLRKGRIVSVLYGLQ